MKGIVGGRTHRRGEPGRPDVWRAQASFSSRGLLAIAAVVATIAAGCAGGTSSQSAAGPSSSAATTGAPSAAPSIAPSGASAATSTSPSTAGLRGLSTTEIGVGGTHLEAGLGGVWAASDAGLVRLTDPSSPQVVLPGPVIDIAVGSKAVYALVSGGKDQLVEVDPKSGKTLRHWDLTAGAKSLVAFGDAAYVDHGTHPATIDRIDLKTGAVRPVTISAATDGLVGGQALAAGDGLVWATDGTTVFGLDPATLAVRRTGHVSAAVDDIWFGDGSVWAAGEQHLAGVHRIDPATGSEVARGAGDAVQIAFSPRGVWLSASAGPTEIDPTTAAIIGTLPDADIPADDAFGITVVGDEVWVAYKGEGQLQRIGVP